MSNPLNGDKKDKNLAPPSVSLTNCRPITDTRNSENGASRAPSTSGTRRAEKIDSTEVPGGREDSGGATSNDSSDSATKNSKPQAIKMATKDGGKNSKSCCFCWCCCCTCSCLSVEKRLKQKKEVQQMHMVMTTKSDKAPNNGDSSDSRPTLEEIRSWGDSFERLMKSSAGRKVFREFLQCEYSEENILFWGACEELKKEKNQDVIEEKARIIYDEYVSVLSPKEVSLDSKVRETVNRNMAQPNAGTFDEAQVQIYTLMQRDSYPRFLSSSLYRKMAQLK